MKTQTLFTIGHSTRSIEELIDILRAYGITCVVDVRAMPRSRTNPQFDIDTLQKALGAARIRYVHIASLGGRRGKSDGDRMLENAGWEHPSFRNYADYASTAPFRAGLQQLLDLATRETSVIMCAETLWWRCHRRIVADHVIAHGIPVTHVFTKEKSEPAALTPFAVLRARARVSYPALARSR